MVLFVLYRVVLIFESLDEILRWFRLLSLWTKSKKVTNQMKATGHFFFSSVLFITLYNVVLITNESGLVQLFKLKLLRSIFFVVLSDNLVFFNSLTSVLLAIKELNQTM